VPDTEARSPYRPPTVTFHGRVGELTGSHGLVVGSQALRFGAAFASSLGAPGAGVGNGGSQGVRDVALTGGAPGGGGGATGGGPTGGAAAGAGGGGHGGGKLPFTGLAVIGVAGVGAALSSAGAALRRLARRQS
jgi:hypothetical protein